MCIYLKYTVANSSVPKHDGLYVSVEPEWVVSEHVPMRLRRASKTQASTLRGLIN